MRKKLHQILLEPTDNTFLQLFRYCFVAGGAFIVDFGTYAILAYFLQIHYTVAAVAGFFTGTSTNYLLSKYLVFTGEPKSRAGEVLLVFIISGGGLVILELGLLFFTETLGVHYLISKLIMTIIVFLWNFFARKFFMYSKYFNILKK